MYANAIRIGAGNIVGVTSAIMLGGPGALFWMWVSASFGMIISFIEGTLSQIFKKQVDDMYVGGMMYYAQKILNNSMMVGIVISIIYILYAIFCLPAQGFYTIEAIDSIALLFSNATKQFEVSFNVTVSIFVLCLTAIIVFGGVKFVIKYTNIMTPLMCILYIIASAIVLIFNIDKIPLFFKEVIYGAFSPKPIFGGLVGIAMFNGVRRGLMSNEAGQGTITIPSSLSDSKHPVEQGFISALGVFLDTFIICSLTGFIVVIGQYYLNAESFELWRSETGLHSFLYIVDNLQFDNLKVFLKFIFILSFGLFSYSTLLCMISTTEVAITRITNKNLYKIIIRLICIFVASFGVICNALKIDFSNLWVISDLADIFLVYIIIPLIVIGFKYVKQSLDDYVVKNK